MKKIALFGSGTKGIASQVSAQVRINCFYELIPDGDKEKIYIRGTPGLLKWISAPNNLPIRGIYTYNSILYFVAGSIMYSVNQAETITTLGSLYSTNGNVIFSNNGQQIIMVDGLNGYVYDLAAGTLKQIGWAMVLDNSSYGGGSPYAQGTGYVDGTYTNVPLTGGTGTGAKATIVVSGTKVTNINLTTYGQNYVVGDALSAANTNLGGTGSGLVTNVTQINNGFPNGTTSIANLDNYFVAIFPNSQEWSISNNGDGMQWNALQFSLKDSAPDNVVACDVIDGQIILWGEQSIEFWQDAGTFPFPMTRLNGSTLSYGLAGIYSRARVGDSIYFLGQTPQGTMQVYSMIDFSIEQVSTRAIEHIISGLTVAEDAIGLSYIVDGHFMYQLTFPSSNLSLLYDTTTKAWSQVQTGLSPGRHQAQFGIVFKNKNYVTDFASGKIYELKTDYYYEEGDAILREVDTRHIWSDGDVFTIGELWLDMETGSGTQIGQGKNPQIMLQVSKDGGRTFGSPMPANIGKVGDYLARVSWRRIGSARDFVFKFTMTDPVPFILIGGAAVISKAQQG